MVGFDDKADIVDFDGKCVGWLKLTVALGSPEQVNTFDSIQAERDLARAAEEEERQRHTKRKKAKDQEADTEQGRNKELETLLRELIDTLKDKSSGGSKREKGKWEDNHLDSLRKLFEECRLDNTKDVKAKVFKESVVNCKNLKKVPLNHFENDLLDNTTLNRRAVSNILKLWDYSHNSYYDLDQLQASYLVYCRYCNYAEKRVKSIFEKLQAFFQLNDEAAKPKKPAEDHDEDEVLRNKNIAAMWCKDKEMKEGFNLIVDLFQGKGDQEGINMEEFLAFIKNPPYNSQEHIPLIALKHDILTEKVVSDMIKDFNVASAEEILEAGERLDFLLDPIESFDFLSTLVSNEHNLVIWEVQVLFDHINKQTRDEPQRYHVCSVKKILETLQKPEIYDKYEEVELEKRRVLAQKKQKRDGANARKGLEDINDFLNDDRREERKSPKKSRVNNDESDIFDRQHSEQDPLEDEEQDDDDEIFDILNDNKPQAKKEDKKAQKVPRSPVKGGDDTIERDSAEFMIGKRDYSEHVGHDGHIDQSKTVKIKHIFEVNVKELVNVVILRMILKDLSRGTKHSESKSENKYIQDVFVKYIFPIDDEQIVSDYIEFNPKTSGSLDYNVSMHSYHTYLLEPNKSIVDSLKKCGESFTMSLSCLKEGQDMNIGNVQMPIEDLICMAEEYENTNAIDMERKQTKSKRILFLYGTRFSQREDMLIGKMSVEFTYRRELVETSSNRGPGISISNDLYLQKEVYINRKIPLNGYLNINVGALSNLKDSLENIEYLMSLYNHPDSRDNMCDRTLLSAHHFDENKRTENIDRRRALHKIYKEGFNLGVVVSVFEETEELRERFGKAETKVVFRTLNPDFDFEHELRLKMDTKIFDHLKYRFAVFEVRHYFINDGDSFLDLGRHNEEHSEANSDFQTDNRDFITLGYAKVPLTNLITRSNGVDQDVAVLDQFNQKFGYLKLKLSLNYQSKKALKLLKEPAEKPLEGKYFLALSFIELISQNNGYLHHPKSDLKHLILKLKWNGVNHQVRYIPETGLSALPLHINVYDINKIYFIDFELDDSTFEKSATPLEIQLWTKIENPVKCMQDRDELIGSVFIDLQSLLRQRHNQRLRNESTSILNSHDGYYTILDNKTDTLMADRLGISTMFIKQEYEGQKTDLEQMFYTLHTKVRKVVLDDYDLNLKGSIEVSDLKKVLDQHFTTKKELDLVYKYFDLLELKDPDNIFYSPYLNTLPPFLKYVRGIDNAKIIEFMYKRLASVDNYGNGFVDNNMFRSILEKEVSFKEKIVENFALNMKPNPLDYNLITHTMKLKTDYLMLVRKLYGYLIHWGILKLGEEVKEQEVKKEIPQVHIPEERRCNLKIQIIGANNVKCPSRDGGPPNTYVCFRNPFETADVELRTPVVIKSTFPQWGYEHDLTGISISEICSYILKNPLEFEIYHKKLLTDTNCSTQESILIGKAYIDASNLLKDPEEMSINGYYHIFENERDRHLDDYTATQEVTRGQLKIQLTVNKPLLLEFDLQDTEKRQQKAIMKNLTKDLIREDTKDDSEENALQRAIRKAKELRAKRKDDQQQQTATRLRRISRSPERRSENKENLDDNEVTASITELRVKRDQHFRELNELTTRLKTSLSAPPRDDPFEDSVINEENEDDLARATSQTFGDE